jgi:hypothetical protein
MNEEEVKALEVLIKQCQKDLHTGSIQLNWFKGAVGTVQVLSIYKLDALVANFTQVK